MVQGVTDESKKKVSGGFGMAVVVGEGVVSC